MINSLINLANYLDRLDLNKEAGKVDVLIKLSSDVDDLYFKEQMEKYINNINGGEFVSKKTKKTYTKLPQPLSLLAPGYKGWGKEQLMLYDHLKVNAVEVLLNKQIQIWPNPLAEDAQYYYFELLTPDGEHLYEDKDLKSYEELAAELTAEKFPKYFISSQYLNDSFPNLISNAEQAMTDIVYWEEELDGYSKKYEDHNEDSPE